MKKSTKIILLAVIFFFVLALGVLKIKGFATGNPGGSISQETFANLKIDNGASSQSFDISGFVGKTALEATEAKTKTIANGSGANAFVTSINGRSADTAKREFWELDINGSESQVGAGTYIIKNHDEIEWKIANY